MAAALLPPPAVGSGDRIVPAKQLERQVAVHVNAVRGSHGLRPLRLSPGLTAAARAHSREMVLRGFFEHESRNGAPFWRRIERSYGSRGFRYWEVGENLAWSPPYATAVGVVRQWLGSPPHRTNLLSATWRELGVGAFRVPRAGGTYGGRPVTIVTLDLGVRSR